MAVQNKKVKYYGDSLKNPILGEFTEKKIYKGIALKEGLGFNRDYLRKYCLKFSLLISAQLTSFTHSKHAISDYLYW